MEPIKIEITVDLGTKALSAIEGLAAALSANVATAPAAPATTRRRKTVETKETPAPVEAAQEAPAEQPAAPAAEAPAEAATPAAPAVPDTEDLPITDDELRQIVKEARDRTSFPAVRGLFNEFGIKASIECPMERRAELVDRLNKLVA